MLLPAYLMGAFMTLGICLRAFLRDHSTPKTDKMSWVVLLEATLFWPIVLPLAYFERGVNINHY